MKDYAAACKTISVSTEASACMSRRCLQALLTSQGYNQKDLGPQIDALLKDTTRQVLAQLTEPCTGPPNLLATKDWTPPPLPCTASDLRYTLRVQTAPSAATLDLSKQLLVLIGNLMTMAVSFYFAGRTADKAAASAATDPNAKPKPEVAANRAATNPDATPGDSHDSHVDGCNVPITNPTPDQALPAAQGGPVSK